MRRSPSRGAIGPLAVLAVVMATAASAAVKLTPGQELVYTGTAEWKVSGGGTLGQAITGVVRMSALVTEADSAKGYAVIQMREFKPGEPGYPADVSVGSVRYGADLAVVPAPAIPSGPVGGLLQQLSVPLSPRADLKSGDQWRRKEALPTLPPPMVEVVCTVGDTAKVGERSGLTIEKKLAQPLPLKRDLGQGSLELTDYGQTTVVDPESGQVLSDRLHGSAHFTAGSRQITLEYNASANLQESRQLPATELASRVKQAAILDRVQRSLFTSNPNADRKQAVKDGVKEIAAFRREYADSPYSTVAARLGAMLGELDAQAQRDSRLDGLKGGPAPAFTLKSLAGKEQALAAYRGKIVVLNFFASWCGPCNAEAPLLEKAFWQKYRSRGVVVLGVNTGERGHQDTLARQFRDKHKLTYPVLLDIGDKVAARYGLTAFPTNVVIDRNGRVVETEVGFNPDGLQQAVDTLLRAR